MVHAKPTEFPTVAAVVSNALDFLNTATSELEARPKQSVIAFYTAVELFLKARLMHEHWSLVVARDHADRDKFAAGDFQSVTFHEACARLDKVVGSPLSKSTFDAFDTVRKHRNKMVHFYHTGAMDPEGLEAIATEQLIAWLALRELLSSQWREALKGGPLNLILINHRFAKHRKYFLAKWNRVREQVDALRAGGSEIDKCPNCEFEAAETVEEVHDVFTSTCLVCNVQRGWLVGDCPRCQQTIDLGGAVTTCPQCFEVFGATEVAEQLDTGTSEGALNKRTPANCAECQEDHTVFERDDCYLCASCLTDFSELYMCEWCEEFSTEDMSSSYIKGCSQCDGASGTHM